MGPAGAPSPTTIRVREVNSCSEKGIIGRARPGRSGGYRQCRANRCQGRYVSDRYCNRLTRNPILYKAPSLVQNYSRASIPLRTLRKILCRLTFATCRRSEIDNPWQSARNRLGVVHIIYISIRILVSHVLPQLASHYETT